LKAEQTGPEYIKHNPLQMIPCLIDKGVSLVESVPIMEYLEEAYPNTHHLLPKDAIGRAKVRALTQAIVSDIQPIQNMRVLKKVSAEQEKKNEWAKYWIEEGFKGLEKMLETTAGKYCYGDEVTMADCVLVPQVYNAIRFGVDMKLFPIITRVNADLSQLEAFKKSDAANQPDTPKTN
jgi:maleylacetoacetate isomerase